MTILRLLVIAAILSASVHDASGDIEQATQAFQRGEYESAMKMAIPLAEQGNTHAQYLVGQAYRNGHGVPLDYGVALDWLRRAAQHGDPRAQLSLGDMYIKGLGTSPDPTEGARWIRFAAEQGYPRALASLGSLHEQGKGVSRDLVEAHVLFDIAIRRARPIDRPETMVVARDRIAKRLTQPELSRARQRSQTWIPKLSSAPTVAAVTTVNTPAEVDFRNFTFPPGTLSQSAITMRNGEYKREDGVDREYYWVADVVFGELSGVAGGEAIVVVKYNGGGNGVFSEGLVFALRDRTPTFLVKFEGGDRANGIHSVRIERRKLLIERGGGGSMATPDYIETRTYRLVDSHLTEVAAPIRRKFEATNR